MKPTLIRLSQQYEDGLAQHLTQKDGAGVRAALALGRRAVVLHLETLDLARMHEQAVINLKFSSIRPAVIRRAQTFFTEAITPMVETHRAARESRIALNRLNELLARCTTELAASNRKLKLGIVRRRKVEAALKKNGADYTRLLKDSRKLQEGFRQLTRQVLAAQEEERKKISHELQDEVAQTLLGINVRLLSLKQEANQNTAGLKNEIASTQRLVASSVKSVRLVADRLGSP
jgi:signal transduction histidine kinase